MSRASEQTKCPPNKTCELCGVDFYCHPDEPWVTMHLACYLRVKELYFQGQQEAAASASRDEKIKQHFPESVWKEWK